MRNQKKSFMILAIITTFIAMVVFLPKLIGSGELKPSAPPVPTMKTLDQIPPTWSQKLDASERFELVLDGEAVLDKETGLVWERSPEATPRTLDKACLYCYQKVVGGRMGWRLPSIEELTSLIDPNVSNPALPGGHPFSGVQSASYWSSTTAANSDSGGLFVGFFFGAVKGPLAKNHGCYAWCVRGGHGRNDY